MRTGELERSVSWDKRLVDILGDCCKHYLRVNDLITDRGHPLRFIMLSTLLPEFVQEALCVNLVGASKILIFSCTKYIAAGPIEAGTF